MFCSLQSSSVCELYFEFNLYSTFCSLCSLLNLYWHASRVKQLELRCGSMTVLNMIRSILGCKVYIGGLNTTMYFNTLI